MENTNEAALNKSQVLITAVQVGLVVATFLLNTWRLPKAIELCNECLILLSDKAMERKDKYIISIFKATYFTMFKAYYVINDCTNVTRYGRKLLELFREFGEKSNERGMSIELATLYQHQCKYMEAIDLWERIINIAKESGDRKEEAGAYSNLGFCFFHLGKNLKAEENLRKSILIRREIGDKKGEAKDYRNLGRFFNSLSEYDKVEKYLKKSVTISKEIGDRKEEAHAYETLGYIFFHLEEYVKAKTYFEETLAIEIEIGNRQGQAISYGNLGHVFRLLGKYTEAEEYLRKAIAIRAETGDEKGKGNDYENLGLLFNSLFEYAEAEKYLKKSLDISNKIGDKNGEATGYSNLASVLQAQGKFIKAKQYFEKQLAIILQIGDKNQGAAACYGNLAFVLRSLGECSKVEEYYKKALAISTEIGDTQAVGHCCADLGDWHVSLGEYVKAKEYLDKALTISREIGDKKAEATSYSKIGSLFLSLGDFIEAEEYFRKSLAITTQIGDIKAEATNYANLGAVSLSLGSNFKANEYFRKALTIFKEIGFKKGEGRCYGNLGTGLFALGESVKAKDYFEKALAIHKQIGEKEGEAADYINLGSYFLDQNDFINAEEYFNKALTISQDILDGPKEVHCLCKLTSVALKKGSVHQALMSLFYSVKKSEELRYLVQQNDHFNITHSDKHTYPYRTLSQLCCAGNCSNDALYVEELGRARALANLMSVKYLVESQVTANPQSWVGIERIAMKEINSTSLYISCFSQSISLWVLETCGVIHFRRNKVVENGLVKDLNVFLAKTFRGFGVLPGKHCEDRSLDLPSTGPTPESSLAETSAPLRLIEEDDQEEGNQEPEPSLSLYYKLIIAPVADLLKKPEIIIVPDGFLYKVPFAALQDERGEYLSQTFKIRIVPSLTTLQLIQDSRADYHSQTKALIVGDPDVGFVQYKGYIKEIGPLPFARREAKMIGSLLGTEPLLGKHATKQAILQIIDSVSLIHFAAHGDAERGEIALAPPHTEGYPKEPDYLLTMSDISKVRLRAKLVVLSCCHSGSGQIRAEGVVGIARAFLGSGARSVLAALWAIEDSATEQLMSRLYKHLVDGESASDSLNQAMEWMRNNGYPHVRDWAPFMLIGDNVTFAFEK